MRDLPELHRLAVILAILLLVAYALPWLQGANAALTFAGYDLAEWVSLHPEVRGGSPPLLATFLLRLPLACVALLVSFLPRRLSSQFLLWRLLLVLTLVAAQLPPLEFLTVARGDPNYEQQFALAAFTLVTGAAGLVAPLARYRRVVALFIALVGAVACAFGFAQAWNVAQSLSLPSTIGLGIIMTTLLFTVSGLLLLVPQGKQTE